MSSRKIVICGAGFLGSHIAKAIASANSVAEKSGAIPPRRIQISSRNPEKLWKALRPLFSRGDLLPPVPVDITNPSTIKAAFRDADMVVSLVGILHGSPADFENIQWKGAENVAIAAKNAGARLVHFSAIGADPHSKMPYVRTKGLAEQSVFRTLRNATIVRPSLVFGPEDDFFNRFARLSTFLPFLPVFGGGTSRFQPVYVGDLARFVEIISRHDLATETEVQGQIIEAGGPEIFTYRELMQMVLDITNRKRPIISFPFALGTVQGAILERLPLNLFTMTRSQVEQLKHDNIVDCQSTPGKLTLENFMLKHSDSPLHSIQDILPSYLH